MALLAGCAGAGPATVALSEPNPGLQAERTLPDLYTHFLNITASPGDDTLGVVLRLPPEAWGGGPDALAPVTGDSKSVLVWLYPQGVARGEWIARAAYFMRGPVATLADMDVARAGDFEERPTLIVRAGTEAETQLPLLVVFSVPDASGLNAAIGLRHGANVRFGGAEGPAEGRVGVVWAPAFTGRATSLAAFSEADFGTVSRGMEVNDTRVTQATPVGRTTGPGTLALHASSGLARAGTNLVLTSAKGNSVGAYTWNLTTQADEVEVRQHGAYSPIGLGCSSETRSAVPASARFGLAWNGTFGANEPSRLTVVGLHVPIPWDRLGLTPEAWQAQEVDPCRTLPVPVGMPD